MKQQATGGATREAVKEYLQQYHMARERRRILERRHDVLARELKAPAPGSAYMTMPASHSAAESEGAVSVVFRLSEVEERIEAQRIAMGRAVTMVMDLIDLLPENSMERTVVELRHIDCKKWERICKEVHMSRSRVNVYYNAALDIILSLPRRIVHERGGPAQTPFALGRSCRGAAQGLPCEFATPSPVRVLSEK